MIEKVIFDLSEVLIPGLIGIENRLEEITGRPRDLIAKALGSHPYYESDNNLESLLKGDVTYQEYRSGFMKSAELPEKYEEVFDKECLKMFESPYSHTQEMIQRVAKSCDLYLLSDHCEMWAKHIQRQHDFFRYFKGSVWSYEVSATKKSQKPFLVLIEKYALNPTECLFVDDNQINISIAGNIGFKTVRFLGKDSVPDIYRAIENG